MLKLMATTDGVITEEAQRRILYWLTPETAAPWTWG